MLHLHGLVWLTSNLAFSSLRHRLLRDKPFASRIIRYLEAIIVQSLDPDADSRTNVEPGVMPPSTKVPETDYELHVKLSTNSYAVACKKQVHSSNHNATCFKYSEKGQGAACRLGMPRDLVPSSKVDEFGVIHLAQNHS
jgi:hypothetical protein